MGVFDGFAEGLASAVDDIRHQVIEQPMYGQQTTGNIQLAQEEPPVEAVSWAQATQDIAPPQIEPPAPTQELER